MDNSINKDLLDIVMKRISEEHNAEYKNVDDKIEMIDLLEKYLNSSVENVKVTKHINEPFKGMGYISVTGKDIIFESPGTLATAAALASNVDIYPKTDGTVQVDFTFHGIAKKVK